ncbi:MAG: transcriptional repressor [Candidatus Hatepunaea meridiana]|nr:transcriptional repressor [Candidatus Hatepunaea meridiana]
MTKQRKVILEELHKVTSHPTADMVYEMVRKRLPHISLGTVYRNLEDLADQGEIRKLSIDGTRMRFDGNPEEHTHIRCIVCGRVDDIHFAPTVSMQDSISDNGYKILGHKLEFYGKCSECRKKDEIMKAKEKKRKSKD